MSRWQGVFVTLLLGWLTLVGASAQAALQITDDMGVVVQFERSPQRIVSLLPSLAETVCELGQCQRLVGVDRYTNWPDSLKNLPRLGGGLDPHIEQVVALRPDMVLMASSSRAVERLRALGMKVVALEPKSHADVQRVLLKLGQLLEVSDAARVWRGIDAAVTSVAHALPAGVRGTRVYLEVNSGPYAASESSFMGETLARLGVSNIVPASLGPFPKLNPEYVVRANPDLIIMGHLSLDGLEQRPGWRSMQAIRGGHLCVFSAEAADTLARAGPRLAEGARLLAQCLASKSPGLRLHRGRS